MATDHARGNSGSFGEVTLDVGLGRRVSAVPLADEPFRIVVLGDLRGRGERDADSYPSLDRRRPVAIDRDDFDEVLAGFAPELTIALSESAPELSIPIRELDDFHPDRLFENLPLFRSLRETRRRLADPTTFREAAGALRNLQQEPPAALPAPASLPVETGGLLDRILDEPHAASPPTVRRDDLADYIRRIVAPHVVSSSDPGQQEALARLDTTISGQMRALLHHPEFQALEALWRGIHFMVRRMETGVRLQLHLLDVSRAELAADLASDRELPDTTLYRLMVGSSAGSPGAAHWALLIGSYRFGPRPEELSQLQRLGSLARHAGGPWLAAADPRLVGCASFADTSDPDDWDLPIVAEWSELRKAAEAESIGLVFPRLLLRLPYGKDTDPCELFRFEEFDGGSDHDQYLWGNPALACGVLLAQAFSTDGWELRPGTHRELHGLPLHLIREAGAVSAKPCAEAVMTERAAARILESGVMPLASIKDQDAALLVRFQSIASPSAVLAGRWNRPDHH